MAEGIITRRGGESKPMRVVDFDVVPAQNVNEIVIPELIDCKCFYIFATNLSTGNHPLLQTMSYFDGENVCIGAYAVLITSNFTFVDSLEQTTNAATFDTRTGTISNLPYAVKANTTYRILAYMEEV